MQIPKVVEVGDDAAVAREKSVLVRLTADTHAKWSKAAAVAKRTIADFARVVVDEYIEAHAPAKPTAKRKTDATAIEQLNWLRKNRPQSYDQLMAALAEIVAIARDEGTRS